MKIIKLTLALIICFILQGCVAFMAGAAAGAGTAAVVHDKRTIDTIREDQTITYDIENKLYADGAVTKNSSISVATFNNVVLLVGQTPTPAARQFADNAAQTTIGVRRVYNEVTIGPNIATLIATNDAWITAKIKTLMLSTEGLHSGEFKVVTENSIVYLMGRVTHQQADMATSIARRVAGVQKVVKIFDYIKAR